MTDTPQINKGTPDEVASFRAHSIEKYKWLYQMQPGEYCQFEMDQLEFRKFYIKVWQYAKRHNVNICYRCVGVGKYHIYRVAVTK